MLECRLCGLRARQKYSGNAVVYLIKLDTEQNMISRNTLPCKDDNNTGMNGSPVYMLCDKQNNYFE